MSPQDLDQLTLQLDGTAATFDDVFAALDANTDYDDGTGSLQDPNVAMGDCVIEVIELRAVRLLLSTGGPRVVAEAIIERDGRASGHQLVGSTLSDQLVRSVSASSGVGRALQHHVDYLSQVS
jgi:hypothetical protein